MVIRQIHQSFPRQCFPLYGRLDQEHEGNKELLKHHEYFKSLDLDVIKPVKTLLHHWDDVTNPADLQDEDKSSNDESKSDDVAVSAKIPKNTVPFRDSDQCIITRELYTG